MSTFNTERFKELVAYAIKGSGFNKTFELSTYIGIKVENNILYLNTTDGTNYVRVSDKCNADDMDVTVNAELFSKLIGKINSDTIDMEVTSNALVINGNGKYTLEIVPDENGNQLSFPDKFPKELTEIGKISAVDLIAIQTSVGPSLSAVAGAVYTNYYVGDIVAGTDKAMVSVFNRNVFDKPYLLNKQFIDLLSSGNADVVVSTSDKLLVGEAHITDDCSIKVCTFIQDNVSDFGIDAIKKFSALEANSFCRFKKVDMLDLLDRISLFVSKFDDGAITLHFTEDSIEVQSLSNAGVERVDITEFKNAEDLTIKININRLRSQLKAYNSDMVDMYYGSNICIKLIDGDMTQIIALMK